MEKTKFRPYRKHDPSYALEFAMGDAEFDFSNPNVCHTGGGSGGGGSSAPANTTANNTDTIIQQAPAYSVQYISDLLGKAAAESNQPYQQFPGQQVAELTPDQLAAFSNVEGLTGAGGAAATQGAAANSLAGAQANTASGIAGAGSPYLMASSMYNPATAAAPYAAASAAATTPQGISSYMSPYLNDQIAGLQTLAQQNWNQFTAPGVNNSFISAGQSGSGRNEQVLGQQANLANQALTAQIAGAKQNAYTTAGQQAAAAGSNLSGLGNLAGTTAASEAANLQNIGTGLGNLQATQAGAQGAAASNLAGTANTVQNTGITGASALQAVGQQQQAQNQANINTAISNFQAQNQYPEQQAGFLNSIINGLPISGGTTTQAGQTPTTTGMIGSISPLGSLAGSLVGAGALFGAGGGKEGGLVSSFADGGQVEGDSPDISQFLSMLSSSGQDQNSTPVPPPDAQSAPPQSPISGIDLTQFNPPPENIDFNTMSAAISTSQNALPKTSTPPPTLPPSEKTQVDSPLNTDKEQAVTPSITNNLSSGDAQTTQDYEEPSGNLSSSLGMKPLDENKMRQYQLLSMAKGLLTPAHSGAESLGNAFGNYAQSGTDFMKLQQQQQERVAQYQMMNAWHQGNVQNAANRNQTYAQRVNDQGDIGQQRADTAQQIADQKKQAEQDKWQIIPDQVGGFLKYNKSTGETQTIAPVNNPGSPAKMDEKTGQPLTGQSYLDDLKNSNPSMAAQVKAMDEGDLNFPTGFAAKAPYWQQRLDALYRYNPGASQQTAAALKAFNQGPQGNQSRFLNVAVNHLDTLDKLTDALDNNDTKALNTIGNFWKSQTGSPAPTNFNTAKNIVGNEVTKAVVGAGGTGEDRAKAQQVIDAANSPAQLKGAIQTYKSLMAGQLSGLKQQYEVSTGRKDYDRYLTDAAKAALLAPQQATGQNIVPQSPAESARAELARRAAARQTQGAQ